MCYKLFSLYCTAKIQSLKAILPMKNVAEKDYASTIQTKHKRLRFETCGVGYRPVGRAVTRLSLEWEV